MLLGILQHPFFASLLQTSSFSSETSFSHSGEKEVNPSSFFCSALKAGQFSLDLHSHPSWHRPENITLNDSVELFSHLTYHIPSDCWPNAKHTVARRSTRVILRPLGTQRFSLYWPILHNLSPCCSVGAPVVLTNPLTVFPLTTWLSLPACWCTQRTPRRRSLCNGLARGDKRGNKRPQQVFPTTFPL